MITELVTFKLPARMTREQVVEASVHKVIDEGVTA